MNIDETLSYIHAVCWRSSIPGLERIRALLATKGKVAEFPLWAA